MMFIPIVGVFKIAPEVCAVARSSQEGEEEIREVDRQLIDAASAWPNFGTARDRAQENEHLIELLRAVADVNATDSATGDTALHLAVRNDRPDLARVLLEWGGVNPNIRNRDGRTPRGLMYNNDGSHVPELWLTPELLNLLTDHGARRARDL